MLCKMDHNSVGLNNPILIKHFLALIQQYCTVLTLLAIVFLQTMMIRLAKQSNWILMLVAAPWRTEPDFSSKFWISCSQTLLHEMVAGSTSSVKTINYCGTLPGPSCASKMYKTTCLPKDLGKLNMKNWIIDSFAPSAQVRHVPSTTKKNFSFLIMPW